jgi:hypothetical protein
MIEFQRHVTDVTIRALMIPLVQEVFSHLVACQCALAFVAILKSRFPVPYLAVPPTVTHRSAALHAPLDLLTPMGQFSSAHYFSCRIIDKSDPRNFTPRIEFDAQRCKVRLLHRALENDRERKASVHSGFALREEQARTSRMHRVERSLPRVQDKDP